MSVLIMLFCFLVLVAEVVKHFCPHLVEIHNYTSAHSISKKSVNWHILNRWIEVFSSCKYLTCDRKKWVFFHICLLHFAKSDCHWGRSVVTYILYIFSIFFKWSY